MCQGIPRFANQLVWLFCIDVTGSRDLFPRYQCWFRSQGRKYSTQSAITFLLTPLEETWMLGCVFSGKSKYGFPNPKTDFEFCLGKSKNGSWIHKIHTQVGFFGSNPNPDFWDSQSERFSGKGFEKSIFNRRFFAKKMVWTYFGGVLLSLSHIIPCLSSIQIIGRLFLNPFLSCFLYVSRVCLRRFIFQVKSKKQFMGFNFKF